jgi:mRNA-degrading endonuclease YafQ of YafQ-DinJ toxin-antitoxin module
MQIRLDSKLRKELEEISKKDVKLSKRIQKQLALFAVNPKHKSLRVHKLSGELNNMWSISISKNIRMSYLQIGGDAYFFDISTHDEVYRK